MSNRAWFFILLSSMWLLSCGPVSPVVQPTTEVTTNAAGERTVTRLVNGLAEGRTLVYRPTGTLRGIFYFQRDSLEGVQRHFYANGRLEVWEQAHRGRANGKAYGFLENGRLDYIKQFVNGQQLGRQLLFYPQPPGRLHKRTAFIAVKGEAWQNGYVEYDPVGRVVAHTRFGFPQARAAQDTVALGDSLTLHLWLPYPERPGLMVTLGDFDEQFRLRDSTAVRRIAGRHHAATVRVPAAQHGWQVVRGYLSDYRVTDFHPRKGKVAVDEQRLYFAYPYFVR